ncbi:glycosyltransferase family 9 protein [Bordetella genomosp. 13]|uniref:glycosyltransferase family 9 protein n=1 Tax=Bordetella genomosp. 13 TaxID=463040 RepID=UPI001642C3DF|nr:glycosyltransferase family 9 protein [Bordetella genomosp. 13]
MLRLLSRGGGTRDEQGVAALCDIQRIIVIRPNYRIGNAVLSTSIIDPLRTKYPGATIDFLATDKTAGLFRNLPVGKVAALSRSAISRPWRMVSLLRNLRAGRYDLAVQLEDGSLTGLLISRLVGARYVIGKPRGSACWYDVNIREDVDHAYDTASVFSRALGVACLPRPQLVFCPQEAAGARANLETLGLRMRDGRVEPYVALFVGGHGDKVCPAEFWTALCRGLDQLQQRFVVFVGPEETRLVPALEHALASLPHGRLCPPRPLREFAAMLAQAGAVITPDSGPMHIAAAVQVPIIAMARSQRSKAFIPAYDDTRIVWNLDVAGAVQAVRELMPRPAAA